MKPQTLMLALNFALCAGVVYIALCRLSAMNTHILVRVHLTYNLLIVSAAASALQYWLWGTYPDWPAIGFAAATISFLGMGARRWRNGVPKEFETDFSKPDF